jgi:hypothetical protein
MQTNLVSSVRAPSSPSLSSDGRYDILFLVMELSDAIRRGVHYYSLAGRRLEDLNSVLLTLIEQGEVSYDDRQATEPRAH